MRLVGASPDFWTKPFCRKRECSISLLSISCRLTLSCAFSSLYIVMIAFLPGTYLTETPWYDSASPSFRNDLRFGNRLRAHPEQDTISAVNEGWSTCPSSSRRYWIDSLGSSIAPIDAGKSEHLFAFSFTVNVFRESLSWRLWGCASSGTKEFRQGPPGGWNWCAGTSRMKRIASVLALPENTEQSLSLWRVIVEGDKTKDNEAANLFETVRSQHAPRKAVFFLK